MQVAPRRVFSMKLPYLGSYQTISILPRSHNFDQPNMGEELRNLGRVNIGAAGAWSSSSLNAPIFKPPAQPRLAPAGSGEGFSSAPRRTTSLFNTRAPGF